MSPGESEGLFQRAPLQAAPHHPLRPAYMPIKETVALAHLSITCALILKEENQADRQEERCVHY